MRGESIKQIVYNKSISDNSLDRCIYICLNNDVITICRTGATFLLQES